MSAALQRFRIFDQWIRFPSLSDPRLPFVAIMTTYVVMGITFLGFNRSPWQVLFTVGLTVLLDFLFHRIFRRHEPPLFPLSAVISGLGMSILINYAHGYWLVLIPIFLTVSSKYLFTYNGRHVFNPTTFAIAVSLIVFDELISVSPPQQWGGNLAVAMFIVTAALVLFVFKINRTWLIVSFVGFYLLEILLRAVVMREFLPPMTLILGTLTSPEFYLFTFFMITDPGTTPNTRKGQVVMAGIVVLVDLLLQIPLLINTLFLSLFTFGCSRLVWLHLQAIRTDWRARLRAMKGWLYRVAVIGAIGLAGVFAYRQYFATDAVQPGFQLTEIDSEAAGISAKPGTLLTDTDPRVAHMAKWLMAVGDSIAVADVDNDGLQDIFLTNEMKAPEDRVALYLNKGSYQFERFEIPELSKIFADPKENGAATGALFFDWNSDGAQDMVVLAAFGKIRFFENRMLKEGRLKFVDVTEKMGVDEVANSVAANAIDLTRTGRLDLVVGNYFSPWLVEYSKPTPFNIFNLPQPEFPEDRRMFRFMPNSLAEASNGGGMVVYRNDGTRFVKADAKAMGLDGEKRWVLAIGTGDLNNDGWTDLYIANDFGPDHLLLNQKNSAFAPVRGFFVGQIGRDTYKGMNASIGDVNNSGYQDIYISNIHKTAAREGSMLLMNEGIRTTDDVDMINDRALGKNTLNDDRWGWGAGMGDLDLDGRLDIVQANGMLNNAYDPAGKDGCRDFWYLHDKMMAAVAPSVITYIDKWPDIRGACVFGDDLNRVYLNRGRHFIDVAKQLGLNKPGESRGVALVDLENKGKLDVLITHQFAPVSIYRNTVTNGNNWVGLQLQGNGKDCNRDAAGTKVSISYQMNGETVQQMREVQIANGFSAQGDRRILFGLGEYSGDVTATIDWCGKFKQTVSLSKGKYHKVAQ